MKITEKIFNIETGEEIITERDETPQEEANRLEREAKIAKEQAEYETKQIARQALLDKLGITEEEAKLLLS